MATVARTQVDLLPHDLETENALLGIALVDPDVMLRTGDLAPTDFWRGINGQVFAVMQDIHRRGEAVGYITVANALREREGANGSLLDDLGGESELTRLLQEGMGSSTAAASSLAAIVKRTAQRRALIRVSAEIAQEAQAYNDGPIDGLYDTVSHALADAMDRGDSGSHLYGTEEVWWNYIGNQERRAEKLRENPDAQIESGYYDLDYLLGDIPPAYLHIVGARSSVGKTIYMEQIAEHNARRGHRVAYYHLELTHQSMLDRQVARYSGVPVGELRRGAMSSKDDEDAVQNALANIRKWQNKLVYIHCPGWTAERIVADMTRLHALGHCDVAIVDYLGKLRLTFQRGRNDAALIGDSVETLKTAAEMLEIPIIAGSQVSRDYKQSADKRPLISDLRGSGEIEEKANQVVMLHRPRPREAGEMLEIGTQEPVEAYVEKNTTGATGKVDLFHVVGWYLFRSKAR